MHRLPKPVVRHNLSPLSHLRQQHHNQKKRVKVRYVGHVSGVIQQGLPPPLTRSQQTLKTQNQTKQIQKSILEHNKITQKSTLNCKTQHQKYINADTSNDVCKNSKTNPMKHVQEGKIEGDMRNRNMTVTKQRARNVGHPEMDDRHQASGKPGRRNGHHSRYTYTTQ